MTKPTTTEPVLERVEVCPFCGCEAERRTWSISSRVSVRGVPVIRHAVECRGCKARTKWVSSAGEAIAAWNQREQAAEEGA